MNGQLELRPEGTDVTPQPSSGARPPRQAVASLTAPGEPLSIPTSKDVAAQFAAGWRRRGFNVELAKHGRLWVVVEVAS